MADRAKVGEAYIDIIPNLDRLNAEIPKLVKLIENRFTKLSKVSSEMDAIFKTMNTTFESFVQKLEKAGLSGEKLQGLINIFNQMKRATNKVTKDITKTIESMDFDKLATKAGKAGNDYTKNLSHTKKLSKKELEQMTEAWNSFGENSKRSVTNWMNQIDRQVLRTLEKMGRDLAKSTAEWVANFEVLEAKITDVTNLISNETERAVFSDKFMAGVRDLSTRLGQDTKDLSNALYDIQSASGDAASAMSTLETVSKAAKAGVAGVQQTADFATSAINALAKGDYGKLQEFMDVTFRTIEYGKLNMKQLAQYSTKTFAIAESMGISFEHVMAALAQGTKDGLKLNRAVAGLEGIIARLSRDKGLKELQKIGINVEMDAEGKVKDFFSIFKQLAEKNITPVDMRKIFTRKQAATMGTVLTSAFKKAGQDGKTAMEDALSRINTKGAEGAMDRAFKRIQETSLNATQVLEQQWNEFTLSIGESIAGVMKPIKQFISGIMSFVNASPVLKTMATGLVTLTLALGGLATGITVVKRAIVLLKSELIATGALKTLSATFFNPVTLSIIALAGAFIALKSAVDANKFSLQEYNKTMESVKRTTEEVSKNRAIIDQYNEQKKAVDGLVTEIIALKDIKNRTTEEEDSLTNKQGLLNTALTEQAEIVKRLKAEYPELAAQYKLTGGEADKFVEKANEMNEEKFAQAMVLKEGAAKDIAKGLGDTFKDVILRARDAMTGWTGVNREKIMELLIGGEEIDASVLMDKLQISESDANDMFKNMNKAFSESFASMEGEGTKLINTFINDLDSLDQLFAQSSGQAWYEDLFYGITTMTGAVDALNTEGMTILDMVDHLNDVSYSFRDLGITSKDITDAMFKGVTKSDMAIRQFAKDIGEMGAFTQQASRQMTHDYILQQIQIGNVSSEIMQLSDIIGVDYTGAINTNSKAIVANFDTNKESILNLLKLKLSQIEQEISETQSKINTINEIEQGGAEAIYKIMENSLGLHVDIENQKLEATKDRVKQEAQAEAGLAVEAIKLDKGQEKVRASLMKAVSLDLKRKEGESLNALLARQKEGKAIVQNAIKEIEAVKTIAKTVENADKKESKSGSKKAKAKIDDIKKVDKEKEKAHKDDMKRSEDLIKALEKEAEERDRINKINKEKQESLIKESLQRQVERGIKSEISVKIKDIDSELAKELENKDFTEETRQMMVTNAIEKQTHLLWGEQQKINENLKTVDKSIDDLAPEFKFKAPEAIGKIADEISKLLNDMRDIGFGKSLATGKDIITPEKARGLSEDIYRKAIQDREKQRIQGLIGDEDQYREFIKSERQNTVDLITQSIAEDRANIKSDPEGLKEAGLQQMEELLESFTDPKSSNLIQQFATQYRDEMKSRVLKYIKEEAKKGNIITEITQDMISSVSQMGSEYIAVVEDQATKRTDLIFTGIDSLKQNSQSQIKAYKTNLEAQGKNVFNNQLYVFSQFQDLLFNINEEELQSLTGVTIGNLTGIYNYGKRFFDTLSTVSNIASNKAEATITPLTKRIQEFDEKIGKFKTDIDSIAENIPVQLDSMITTLSSAIKSGLDDKTGYLTRLLSPESLNKANEIFTKTSSELTKLQDDYYNKGLITAKEYQDSMNMVVNDLFQTYPDLMNEIFGIYELTTDELNKVNQDVIDLFHNELATIAITERANKLADKGIKNYKAELEGYQEAISKQLSSVMEYPFERLIAIIDESNDNIENQIDKDMKAYRDVLNELKEKQGKELSDVIAEEKIKYSKAVETGDIDKQEITGQTIGILQSIKPGIITEETIAEYQKTYTLLEKYRKIAIEKSIIDFENKMKKAIDDAMSIEANMGIGEDIKKALDSISQAQDETREKITKALEYIDKEIEVMIQRLGDKAEDNKYFADLVKTRQTLKSNLDNAHKLTAKQVAELVNAIHSTMNTILSTIDDVIDLFNQDTKKLKASDWVKKIGGGVKGIADMIPVYGQAIGAVVGLFTDLIAWIVDLVKSSDQRLWEAHLKDLETFQDRVSNRLDKMISVQSNQLDTAREQLEYTKKSFEILEKKLMARAETSWLTKLTPEQLIDVSMILGDETLSDTQKQASLLPYMFQAGMGKEFGTERTVQENINLGTAGTVTRDIERSPAMDSIIQLRMKAEKRWGARVNELIAQGLPYEEVAIRLYVEGAPINLPPDIKNTIDRSLQLGTSVEQAIEFVGMKKDKERAYYQETERDMERRHQLELLELQQKGYDTQSEEYKKAEEKQLDERIKFYQNRLKIEQDLALAGLPGVLTEKEEEDLLLKINQLLVDKLQLEKDILDTQKDQNKEMDTGLRNLLKQRQQLILQRQDQGKTQATDDLLRTNATNIINYGKQIGMSDDTLALTKEYSDKLIQSVPHYHNGGHVPDDTLAYLKKDEYVMKPATVNRLSPETLELLNANQLNIPLDLKTDMMKSILDRNSQIYNNTDNGLTNNDFNFIFNVSGVKNADEMVSKSMPLFEKAMTKYAQKLGKQSANYLFQSKN